MDSAISYGLDKLNYKQIRDHQNKGINGYLNGRDVFLCSPTGSGKSLLFEIAPIVFSYRYHHDKLPNLTSSVVVVSPLVSLIRSQVSRMKTLGLKAAYLSDVTGHGVESENSLTVRDIVCGNFDILVCSPESILGEHRRIIKDLAERRILRAIFIDEAHCINKLGKPCPLTKRPAFRPAYGKLGELRSLSGADIPVIALTATATLETQNTTKRDLCMTNCVDIILSPNKKNIRYDVIEVKSDDTRENFEWLIKLLEEKGIDTPRIIVFFRRVEHMSVVFKHVINTLGRKAYVNYKEGGSNDDRNRLIDMFHMKTSDIVKSSICESYADPCGHIRVVLCTTSSSMGLDVKGVDSVVHYGPANNLEDYLQETGRAGRNPEQNCHAVLMKYKKSTGSKNISSQMKQFVLAKDCRRRVLLNSFTTEMEALSPSPAHMCCDNCTRKCRCLCNCLSVDSCVCNPYCGFQDNVISSHIYETVNALPSSSESEVSDISFDSASDSDFEVYRSKKANVLFYSDESSD